MKLLRSRKNKAATLSRTEALACIPEISPGVEWQIQESGDVLVEYPLVVKPLLQAVFKRFNRGETEKLTRKLQLDALGSLVWQYIDGKRRVADIIREFAETTTVTHQEAELSVTTFLRELGRRGLIILR